MMSAEKRIFYYDVLRAVAIAAVILTFAANIYGDNTSSLKLSIPLFLKCIGSIGVPLFLMLSGCLLLDTSFTLGGFFKDRFKRIGFPYIFWIVVAAIFAAFFLKQDKSALLGFIFDSASPFMAMWTTICAFLAFPIYNAYAKAFKLKGLELYLAIWIFTVILCTFNQYPLLRLDLVMFSYYMGFIVLGHYLDNKSFGLSERKMCIIGLIVFALFSLLHMFLSYRNVDLFYPYLNVIVAAQSMGFFIFVKYLNPSRQFAAITSISVCSYGMYFAGYLIVMLAASLKLSSLKMLPLIFIAAFAGSWILMLVLSRIPYLKSITGGDYKWL